MTRIHTPIKRWYDRDAQLSELVHTLETLSPESQLLFGHLLKNTIKRIIKLRGRAFVKSLNWQTFVGIIKSKRSRRWYDQEHILHVVFNMLFSLGDGDKALIGREFSMPAELVQRYEHYAQAHNETISQKVVHSILETCFKEGPEKAFKVYSIFH